MKVAAFGAVGGILFWFLVAFGLQPKLQSWPWYGQLPALALLGAAAGCVGVYILTASDLTQIRTFVFAMLCGMVWKPVLDAGIQTVVSGAINRQTKEVTEKTKALNDSTRTSATTPQALSAEIAATRPFLLNAVQMLPSVSNAGQKTALVDTTNKAVSALQQATPRAPESVSVIHDVATQAIRCNEPLITTQAIRSLGTIAADTKDPGVEKNASVSLRSILVAATKANQPIVAALAQSTLQNNPNTF